MSCLFFKFKGRLNGKIEKTISIFLLLSKVNDTYNYRPVNNFVVNKLMLQQYKINQIFFRLII